VTTLRLFSINVEAFSDNVEAFSDNVDVFSINVEAFSINVEAFSDNVDGVGRLLPVSESISVFDWALLNISHPCRSI
jgi:hypothetical protein